MNDFDFLEPNKDPDSMRQHCTVCGRIYSISELDEDGICDNCRDIDAND